MLTPESILQHQKQLINEAGFCCHCAKPLDESETYCCAECELEIVTYHDPNHFMGEDDDGQS